MVIGGKDSGIILSRVSRHGVNTPWDVSGFRGTLIYRPSFSFPECTKAVEESNLTVVRAAKFEGLQDYIYLWVFYFKASSSTFPTTPSRLRRMGMHRSNGGGIIWRGKQMP